MIRQSLLFISLFCVSLNAQTVITNTDRLQWAQSATTLAIAQAYSYIVYIDNITRNELENVICSGNSSPFNCNSKLPFFTTSGIHTLQIAAVDVTESAKSNAFQVQVNAPSAPNNLGIVNNIIASSCSQSDVQIALNKTTIGSTVLIPPGICHWTNSIFWTSPANITIRGSGNLSVLGGGDSTIIIDDYASSSSLIKIDTNINGKIRIAGLTLQGGIGDIKENGLISIVGSSKQLRIDHIHINIQSYLIHRADKPITLGGWLNGVLDHNIIDLGNIGMVQFSASNYGTGIDSGGDQSFAGINGFGTSDFIFMEDNQINGRSDFNDPTRYPGITTDCNAGGRFVVRYNNITAAGVGQTHPTGGGVGGRGCRAEEIYGNIVVPTSNFNPLIDNPPLVFSWMSSGIALIWGNTSIGVSKNFIYLDEQRKNNGTYTQTPTPNGWGYCGTFFNGTGSNWDGNSNTSSGYPCIDQPGRGQGDLLVGAFPTRINSTTGTIAWPNQSLEPVREWLNTFTAVPGWGNNSSIRVIVATGAELKLIENRDYYLFNSSFNGTVGIGNGTRASRPITCTKGVAYWSTDQGNNWNTINTNMNDGTLDICVSTNNWMNNVYTPYTYPHPLTVN